MPVFTTRTFLQGFSGWLLIVRVFYDGEPFEYTFDLGAPLLSRQSAEAVARRNGCEANALKQFLSEVHTGVNH